VNGHREARRAAREARRADRRAAKAGKKRAAAEADLSLVAAGAPATPEARGLAACTCTKDCTLHGDCLPCVAFHAGRGERPRCDRQGRKAP
jgi:hypothetical protein